MFLANRLRKSQLRVFPEAIATTLSGSGTFTPVYSGAQAIIKISGGGGGGSRVIYNADNTGYNIRGIRGTSGSRGYYFVPNIDVFSGGLYRLGGGGAGGSYVCANGTSLANGSDGVSSYFRSPGNTPWQMTAGGGGRGTSSSGGSTSTAADPMSGVFPSDLSELPEIVVRDGLEITGSALLSENPGSQFGLYGNGASAGYSSGNYTGCAGGQAGSTGIIQIIYLL